MALCRASHAPLWTFAAAIAVGSLLTACGGTSTDGDTTSETSSTTELPTSPGEGSGSVTIEIPSPGIPAPPAIPQPPGPMP
ncbi:hypothetical protein ACP6C7_31080 [Mycolicibacterium septicum]|uniref:Uncharacterized protein n=1 Tax=Mycolicibacterium septicum TaxID=98668 RepID=A0ABW9M5Y3_9MYCO